jgi:folate-dependent phosphoribosylglycinamide formyltransferase PurN
MNLKHLYNPEDGVMRIAGFMSGSGSNLRRIIEYGEKLEKIGRAKYKVVVIFSNNKKSNAESIGVEHDIPVVINDMSSFYKARRLSSTKYKDNPKVREEFDSETINLIVPYKADIIAQGGYMAKVTTPLLNRYLIVNVHPSDLTILDSDGKRKYRGDRAVKKAIMSGEKILKATTHVVTEEIDSGPILMLSDSLEVKLPEDFDYSNESLVEAVAKEHQERLKKIGDWVIFPKTLELIADGKFLIDDSGRLYYNNKLIPEGIRIQELY